MSGVFNQAGSQAQKRSISALITYKFAYRKLGSSEWREIRHEGFETLPGQDLAKVFGRSQWEGWEAEYEFEFRGYRWPHAFGAVRTVSGLYYETEGGRVLCPRCANEHLQQTLDPAQPDWRIVRADVRDGKRLTCACCQRVLPT